MGGSRETVGVSPGAEYSPAPMPSSSPESDEQGDATALQVADMFTKQIFPKHFERLRRVMMGHENFDDMCERYQDAKAAGGDVDDPKICTAKPERSPNG